MASARRARNLAAARLAEDERLSLLDEWLLRVKEDLSPSPDAAQQLGGFRDALADLRERERSFREGLLEAQSHLLQNETERAERAITDALRGRK